MNESTPEAATPPPRPRPHPRKAQQSKKEPHDTKPQATSSQHKQKPHNPCPKSTPKSSDNAVESASLGDYREAPWFKASGGDLVFAHWLLCRCNGVGDTTTPQSEEATVRMFALFKTQRRLRRELAQGSKREMASTKETEEGAEEEEHVDTEEPLWPVEQIVDQVGKVLRASRRELMKQQREAEQSNAKLEGTFERIVVAEVVDNATELILSRGTSEDEEQLRRWVEMLKEEEKVEEKTKIHEENVPEDNPEVDQAATQKSKRGEKKEKKRPKKNKVKLAEEMACVQVETFMAFLKESARIPTQTEESLAAAPSEAEKRWTSELQQIIELSSIELEEEARRLRVALDIQTVLRREVSKWRYCEVILFGSSMSHYGSRTSDLDMCLLPHGRSVEKTTSPKEMVGKRQLQQLIDGKVNDDRLAPTTDAEIGEQLGNLCELVQKSIEKLTLALNTLDRSGKKGEKHTKQCRQLEFFDTQMRLLRSAIMEEHTKLTGIAPPCNGTSADDRPAHLKSIIAASRRRSDDLYLLRAILQRAAKCEVRHVIAGARVPIIRFLHTRSGREYECDLCFENVLATRNTPLLRAYASFDDRARALGLAVKHWAKQRSISDASMGFLSSYSFVLLSIYYLQVVGVLPNLQAPQLLESARIGPDYYNDINIAYCEDRDTAQAFHKRISGGGSLHMSLTTLLLGFFEFYATQFDFAKRVVTVRSPETPAVKLVQWGSRKTKTWRISIQDPLETGRDLGCVLQFKGQEKIISELRRAYEMLAQGDSFADDVCAIEKSTGKRGGKVKQQTNDEVSREQFKTKQQQADKMKRSYVMTLQSADEELTKAIIETLFKDFHKSFRVAKVVEISTPETTTGCNETTANKNKLWEVEVLTQAQNCPRALSQRTRIDWKAADGRVGRVWVHHKALFATPPCQKCLSPNHATGKCSPKDLDGDESESDSGELRINHKLPQKNIRHILHLTIGRDRSSVAMKRTDRRKKQQQHHGPAQDTHQTSKSRGNPRRHTNGKASVKKPHRDKKTELERVVVASTVRQAETIEVVTASRIESETNKSTQKKRKWQLRVHRKRGNSKGGTNNYTAE
ncbi:Poly(A) polymerase [Phytophthora megakarya]|uniref:Poly(A) polymerase n=1 Tax=Phytophthora megakarya TaxID=4795 RepID=A0A225V9I0_9STRA|nr:Poly(A) polymerase [Phytophthora megakarya]